MISTVKYRIGGSALVLSLVVLTTGCAVTPKSAARSSAAFDKTPSWQKHYVAGSRIARRIDHEGQPSTGSYVITIEDEQLQQMQGFTLGEKLSGVPSIGR